MSASIELSTQNRHYQRAQAGLEAIAKAMKTQPEQLGLLVNRQMTRFLRSSLEELAKRHSRPHPGGTTDDSLSRRSGELVRRLPNAAKVTGKTIEKVEGRVSLPTRYAVQERGGTIKPANSKYVFIPLPEALDRSGKPKPPKSFRNTFVSESRKGNLLIFQKKGREIVPLFLLRKKVRIPPRMGMGESLKRGVPAFIEGVMDRTIESLTKATM